MKLITVLRLGAGRLTGLTFAVLIAVAESIIFKPAQKLLVVMNPVVLLFTIKTVAG